MNESFTLVHHPSQIKKRLNTSPICVTFWFEMGSCIQNKVIQPKFMWKKAHNPDNQGRKQYFTSCQQPDSIDLLSITRVVKADSILDRKMFPFAKLRNSFTLQCVDTNDIYLFEAQNEKECDTLIYGLKCVIAKIASMIIVGDQDVYEEFFTPYRSIYDRSMGFG